MVDNATWTAVRLQVRQWERELAAARIVREQLALQIDQHPGPPGPDLNRLVGRFIDVYHTEQDLEHKLARVRDRETKITG